VSAFFLLRRPIYYQPYDHHYHHHNQYHTTFAVTTITTTTTTNITATTQVYSNRAACFLQAKQFKEALSDAEKSVALCATWSKGYFRAGRAAWQLGDARQV
jgi:tetratricopeptide (TPR) repeat protein